MSYAQRDYQQKQGDSPNSIAQKGSLLVAMCNLFENFNIHVDPGSLNKLFGRRSIYLEDSEGYFDELAYQSITAYDGTIYCSQIAGAGAWPSSNTTIIAFDNGTYHAVASATEQMIVDSWDGEVKSANQLGQPIGWATYDRVIAQITKIDERAVPPTPTVTVRANQPDINIHYEMLAEPRQMYVIKEGGCNKWAFGNIEKIEDLVATGRAKEHENIVIVGIAKVDVGEDQLGYYMDALAFGDYATTGTVKNTVGYAWADLAEGIYVPPEIVIPAPAPAPTPPPDLPPPAPENPTRPNEYKTTYKKFAEPEPYRMLRDVTVQEFDGRGSDKHLRVGGQHEIAGMFAVDGKWYGRPLGAEKIGKWYGIADEAMTPVYDFLPTQLSITDKQTMNQKLSINEQVDVVIARGAAQLERFKNYKKRFRL